MDDTFLSAFSALGVETASSSSSSRSDSCDGSDLLLVLLSIEVSWLVLGLPFLYFLHERFSSSTSIALIVYSLTKMNLEQIQDTEHGHLQFDKIEASQQSLLP